MSEFNPPDSFFVNNIKQGIDVDTAINALTEKHIGIISKNANFYSQATGVCPADLLQDASLIVYRAAESYREDKGSSFSTFLYNSSRFHFLNISKISKRFYNQSTTDPALLANYETPSCDEGRAAAKKKELLDYITYLAESHSNPAVKLIVSLRYFGDKRERSFEHISSILNMTKMGVMNIHGSFMKLCRQKLKAKDLLDVI